MNRGGTPLPAMLDFGAAYPLKQALRPLEDRITSAAIYGSVAKGSDKG